jgi:hypothetical protein
MSAGKAIGTGRGAGFHLNERLLAMDDALIPKIVRSRTVAWLDLHRFGLADRHPFRTSLTHAAPGFGLLSYLGTCA